MDAQTETIALESGDAVILAISGELDLAASDSFSRIAEGASSNAARLIIDLSNCSFMDVAALRRIAELSPAFETRSGRSVPVSIVAPHGSPVARLLIIGTDAELRLFETRVAAIG